MGSWGTMFRSCTENGQQLCDCCLISLLSMLGLCWNITHILIIKLWARSWQSGRISEEKLKDEVLRTSGQREKFWERSWGCVQFYRREEGWNRGKQIVIRLFEHVKCCQNRWKTVVRCARETGFELQKGKDLVHIINGFLAPRMETVGGKFSSRWDKPLSLQAEAPDG